jgi:hypothetical protein
MCDTLFLQARLLGVPCRVDGSRRKTYRMFSVAEILNRNLLTWFALERKKISWPRSKRIDLEVGKDELQELIMQFRAAVRERRGLW